MNWSKLLRLDLGSLLKGRVVSLEPEMMNRSRWHWGMLSRLRFRLYRSLRSCFSTKRNDLIKLTFNLSQSVANNAPLPAAIDALLEDVPTYRLYRVLARLRESLEQGATLADAMRRQPRFFPAYYINLVEAGERTGTLEVSLRDLEELLIQNREVHNAFMFGLGYLFIVLFILSTITAFITVKITPVFEAIKMDFAEQLTAQPTKTHQAFSGDLASNDNSSGQGGKEGGYETLPPKRHSDEHELLWVWLDLLLVGGAVLLVTRRAPKILLLLGRAKVPGLYRASNKVWWVTSARILGRLLQAGYPLDEALTILMNKERSRTFRKVLSRLHTAVIQGRPFYEAVKAEGNRVPSSLRDFTFIGETSGRLPQALMHISHFYQAQIVRTVTVLGNIGFPIAIMGLGCFVFQIYGGTFLMYIDIMDNLMSNL